MISTSIQEENSSTTPLPNQQHICPHCNHIYFIDYSNNNKNQPVSTCEHLLCKTTIVSKVNSPFKQVNDYVVDLNGSPVPLVIFLRFIKFLRERNASGHNPQQGFFTIYQSKTRISNTFQGITVFRLKHSSLNNVDQSQDTITEHSFYLTSNPLNDLSYFESFIIKYYVDILCPITLNIHQNQRHNPQQQHHQSNSNINGNNENEQQIENDQIYAILSNQQLETIFNNNNNIDNDGNGDDDTDSGRWSIILTGLPNHLPIFVWLTPNMIDHNNNNNNTNTNNNTNNNNNNEGSNNYLIPLKIHHSNYNNHQNHQKIVSVKLVPINYLPPIALQV